MPTKEEISRLSKRLSSLSNLGPRKYVNTGKSFGNNIWMPERIGSHKLDPKTRTMRPDGKYATDAVAGIAVQEDEDMKEKINSILRNRKK
jgi:hypothetical protein